MGQWVFYTVVFYFALVGVIQVGLALTRLLGGRQELEGSVLLIPVRGDDPAMELKIREAHGELAGNDRLRGVRLALVDCGGSGETLAVCYRLCADKDLPLVEPGEVPALLDRRSPWN